ncbi:putative 4-alpha-glucanotransferase [Tritrichomonas foetus]|uniref:4-alpha-glucanotransferase n=1 Tax=Tritrichomonas foetus TaxID=1144522 RepID=A0A1J4KKT8_9EUKA|nr:putative 4-alpha-glucanotransferase [Tritrichomonas foetus]|eukprot:OHT10412.1 putative 4-alpha-glucanotransferase [Tritrichomonas foetus]
MLSGTSFIVTFNLRSNFHGDAVPIVYGSIKELGGGDPADGIEMTKTDNIYNFTAKIVFPKPVDANEIWYAYCFRPCFGAIVPESVPRRFMPRLEATAELYDTIDQVTSVGDLLIHFHVRCFTEFGQHLYLTGNLPQLGEWDPDSAIQLFYEGNKDYWTCNVRFPLSAKSRKIEYKYFRSFNGNRTEWESEENHKIFLGPVTSPAVIELADTFRWKDSSLKSLTRAPFIDVINSRKEIDLEKPPKIFPNEAKPGLVNTRFNVVCPNVKKHQSLLLVGSSPELGEWKVENAVKLNGYNFPQWSADIEFKRSSLPFEYKFVVVGDEEEEIEIEIASDDSELQPNSSNQINPIELQNQSHNFEPNEENEKMNESQMNNKLTKKKTIKEKRIITKIIWESEGNRFCPGVTSKIISDFYPVTMIVNNWYVNPNPRLFKGLGIYSPLFSVRSNDSCGIGQYTDIKGLVDVCEKIGSKMIQLLPIFDTTDVGDWPDSYPYRQVSCFALHPIYINLLMTLDSLPSDIYNDIQTTKWHFEQKFVVDYPTVYSYKMKMLKRIYNEVVINEINDNIEFSKFVDQEGEWLRPYALFCYLRDKFGTSDFHNWPKFSKISRREINSQCAKHSDDLQFIYWVQYICDKQFKDARDYASSKGVVLKGDLPIGVNFNSVECWAYPKNFRLDMCSGAPPDEFSEDGQNWGFPTYDWDYMESNGFQWWEMRLRRMYDLFQVLRIDHILGFFRIWEIPRDSCVRGILGHFFPCLPVSKPDLEARGLYDIERYVQPYIRWHLIEKKFGTEFGENVALKVAHKYFNRRGFDSHDDYYDFKPEFNTEKKIEESLRNEFPNDKRKRRIYQKYLFELLSNVMLIHDPQRPGCYHVRTNMTIESNGNESSTWQELPEPAHSRMKELYDYFTFHRHNDLWLSKAGKKLSVLENTTNMLICAEDLGQLTDRIVDCIKSSSLLSLHVQRMPKSIHQKFDEVGQFDYLSVCCPATHDMSTLRGWWEENRDQICEFWKTQLKRDDNPPFTCEPWILEEIIKQNMESNSMWAVFLLQDLTDLIPNFRRQSPQDERINIPSDPRHHWRYRYPYSIDELLNCQEFSNKMKMLAETTHRL